MHTQLKLQVDLVYYVTYRTNHTALPEWKSRQIYFDKGKKTDRLVSEKTESYFGWETGTRTPIGRSRICSPTIGRSPSEDSFILASARQDCTCSPSDG
jgi:hypothetical protein